MTKTLLNPETDSLPDPFRPLIEIRNRYPITGRGVPLLGEGENPPDERSSLTLPRQIWAQTSPNIEGRLMVIPSKNLTIRAKTSEANEV